MTPHFNQLSTKILAWFFLNVIGLLIAATFFVQWQTNSGLGFVARAITNARLQDFAMNASQQFRDQSFEEQAAILSELETEYDVTLALYTESQEFLAGKITRLPKSIATEFPRRPGNAQLRLPPPRARSERTRPIPKPDNRPPNPDASSADPFKLFTQADTSNNAVWAGIKIPARHPNGELSPSYLVVRSDEGNRQLFFSPRPWIVGLILAVIASIAFWIPLVINIERRLKSLSMATDRIAAGELGTRIDAPLLEQDEIALLGRSVNRMASQLEQNVTGQKRFLGDIAHELASPIARIQAALALLERNVAPQGIHHLEKLDNQVQHVGQLINELLLFSKASLKESPKRQRILLAPLVHRAIENELPPSQKYTLSLPNEIHVKAVPSLLERATANILRNSVRYAGPNAGISIVAQLEADQKVSLVISDKGPGVPEEALPRLFDAFYRPTQARDAESGGTGLGLAIVKSCIESSNGRVTARNLSPRGFEIRIELGN